MSEIGLFRKLFRTIIVLFVCLFLLGTASVQATGTFYTATQSAQGDDFTLYTTPTFRIDYPAGWQAAAYNSPDSFFQLTFFAEQPPALSPEDLAGETENIEAITSLILEGQPLVAMLTTQEFELTGEQELREFADGILSDFDFNIITSERQRMVTVADFPAVEVLIKIAGEGGVSGQRFGLHGLLVDGGGTDYLFVAGGLEDIFEANRAHFQHMIDSLVLTPGHLNDPFADIEGGFGTDEATLYEGPSFRMLYPDEWQASPLETFEYGMVVFAPQAITLTPDLNLFDEQDEELVALLAAGEPLAGLLALHRTEIDTSEPIDEMMSEALEELMNELTIPVLRRHREVAFGDFRGIEAVGVVQGQGPLSGNDYGVYAALFYDDTKVYVFAGISLAEDFETYQPVFLKMLASLQTQ